MRVTFMALRPAWSWNPRQFIRNIRHDDFWDTAKASHYPKDNVPAKITWDDEFVDEVKRTWKACKVFLFFPFYWLCESDF